MIGQLPGALVIGPMKAGTTWISQYLYARGDVSLPQGVKETFFFDRHFHKGLQWYADHFEQRDARGRRQAMEVAPSYFHHPAAPARVQMALGEIPLIVTLRDPVRRAWSHYMHLRRYGYTSAPLQEAVVRHPEILDASRYAARLVHWREYFSGEHIHLLWQEDLAYDPETYARRLCEVLGLSFYTLPDQAQSRVYESGSPPSIRLAALGRRASYALRDRRMYWMVNLAKRLGLRRVFYGGPGKGPHRVASDDDARWLAEQLQEEYEPGGRCGGIPQAGYGK